MKSLITLVLSLVCFLTQAQPGSVPGVRMLEPPSRAEVLLDTATENRVEVPPNRYLAVDVTGLFGKFRRYRIFPGDMMAFRAFSDGEKYRYPLTTVSDTAFTIAFKNELYDQPQALLFPLRDVKQVYLSQRIPFVSEAAYLLPAAGLIYIIADFVNPRGLDGSSGRFTFDSRSLIPGGLLMLGGAICYKLSHRNYRVNDRHVLKVLWTR